MFVLLLLGIPFLYWVFGAGLINEKTYKPVYLLILNDRSNKGTKKTYWHIGKRENDQNLRCCLRSSFWALSLVMTFFFRLWEAIDQGLPFSNKKGLKLGSKVSDLQKHLLESVENPLESEAAKKITKHTIFTIFTKRNISAISTCSNRLKLKLLFL